MLSPAFLGDAFNESGDRAGCDALGVRLSMIYYGEKVLPYVVDQAIQLPDLQQSRFGAILRWMAFRKLLSAALQLLFPGRCLLCGEELPLEGRAFSPVCEACLKSIEPLWAAPRCRICSLPLISEREICTRCRGRTYSFGRNVSLFEYRGEVRELIYQFKFRNRIRIGSVLAGFFQAALGERLPGMLLVPVPGNPLSVRSRGWDPMSVVAGELARSYGFWVRRLLFRRPGSEQKGLGYEQRRSNLAGKLGLIGPVPDGAERVILLDDVFTTGATASACARLLIGAGVQSVEVLSLAIDLP